MGISFLGLTVQECCDERFAKSYSDWFEKVLKKLKVMYIIPCNFSYRFKFKRFMPFFLHNSVIILYAVYFS